VRLKEEHQSISFSYSKEENQLICKVGTSIISSRLIDGEFPDFNRIIPKATKFSVHVGVSEFIRALKIASVFAKDSANVLKLVLHKESISVTAESPTKGSQSTEIEAEVSGISSPSDTNVIQGKRDSTSVILERSDNEAIESHKNSFILAFNVKFLEDYMNTRSGEEIELAGNEPTTPVIFKDLSDSELLHIIMPIKLQS